VVPITPTPPADAFVTREQVGKPQECYPLDLYQCRSCRHVQLLHVVDPELLFVHYSYLSGSSGALVKHFEEYANRVIARVGLSPGALVVDIGSNDGSFLRFFKDRRMRVLGIDPARNVAEAANAAGIETLPAFFEPTLAQRIRRERGPAQVVSANNVFAHTDDMGGMADSVRTLLADNGVFVFEVSYLLDVVDNLLLGTIFHEHLCYHAVRPLDRFLRRHGLELIDVERVGIQGGSLIGTAQRWGGPRPVSSAVGELMELEDRRQLNETATLRAFSSRIEAARQEIQALFGRLQAEGATWAGFGAGRHSTLLIYHFGMGPFLQFIADDGPDKQGLFSPGYHIPVLPSTALYERKPGYTVLLAWSHAPQIVSKHARYLEQSGRFVACFPRVQVVTRESPLV
jgi:SAM-dependent methyltransferase